MQDLQLPDDLMSDGWLDLQMNQLQEHRKHTHATLTGGLVLSLRFGLPSTQRRRFSQGKLDRKWINVKTLL